MPKRRLIEDIVQHPTRFYRAPFDVVRDRRFSDEERLQILGAWEREVREHDGEAIAADLARIDEARSEVQRRQTGVH